MQTSVAKFANPFGRKGGEPMFARLTLLEYQKQYSWQSGSGVLKMSQPIYCWSAGSHFDNCSVFMGSPLGDSEGNRCRSSSVGNGGNKKKKRSDKSLNPMRCSTFTVFEKIEKRVD